MYAQKASASGVGHRVTMFYGGRSSADLVMRAEIAAACSRVEYATDDGSFGTGGRITEALVARLEERDRGAPQPGLFACGPDPMLEAVAEIAHRYGLSAHLSLEGEMACGVGACLVCAVPCAGERPFRYACVHGPVFSLADLRGSYAAVSQ
jgi:dihydroorotate dehydrogenase electron transfer subunit